MRDADEAFQNSGNRDEIIKFLAGVHSKLGPSRGFTRTNITQLKQGGLTYGQTFTNELARDILLTALKINGRFYVLIAFEGTEPKLKSEFPFTNWFAESLEVAEPSPLWVQTPKVRSR